MSSVVQELPDKARDHDVIHDTKGRVYVALGHIQPEDRVLSFLKYLPDPKGQWQSDGRKYKRVFWGGAGSVSKGMDMVPSEYLTMDPHFGTTLLEIPRKDIAKYFSPERRLHEIMSHGSTDALEQITKEMAEAIHDIVGIPFDQLGITGSIVWNAHNPQYSDINMTVYGMKGAWKVYNQYDEIAESADGFHLEKVTDIPDAMSRIIKRTPILSATDFNPLFSRGRHFFHEDTYVGITPVLLPREAPIKYGAESYTSVTSEPIRVKMNVENTEFGLFTPAIYEVISNPLQAAEGNRITRIMVYDGTFKGLIVPRDKIEVSGILQKVVFCDTDQDDKEPIYQIMIGTKNGAGREFIRLITS